MIQQPKILYFSQKQCPSEKPVCSIPLIFTLMKKPLIAPSILAADFGRMNEEIELLNNSEADWVHVDVMDGNFVPNISFGFPVIEAVKKVAKKPLDTHLMINHPDRYILDFKNAGCDILTVQYEACPHLHRTVQAIKDAGMQAGVAINPHTSVQVLEPIIQDLDLVLVMSVNPGFGGQKFIDHAVIKIAQVKALIESRSAHALIEVDGGIGPGNAAAVLKAGAQVLVAGSSVFKAADPRAAISDLKNIDYHTMKV